MTEKKTRNMQTQLGVGVAADRIAALRRELPLAIERAVDEVRDRFNAKEATIVNRVPHELRPALGQVIDAMLADKERAHYTSSINNTTLAIEFAASDDDDIAYSDGEHPPFVDASLPDWLDTPPQGSLPIEVKTRHSR